MARTAQIKYTLPAGSKLWGVYNRVFESIPSVVNGVRLTLSARSILDKVLSLSKRKSDPDACCRFTYEQLREEYGIAKSTVARAIGQLKDAGVIERKERDVDGTEYIYVGTPHGAKHYVIPACFQTAQIKGKFDQDFRTIKDSEVRVLCYLMTECAAPKTYRKSCKTSYKKLARVLKLAESTVRAALDDLMSAHLVFRPKHFKGKNANRLSRYQVNGALYAWENMIPREEMTQAQKDNLREKYYQRLRDHAREVAASNLDYIRNRSPRFRAIENNLNALTVPMARAKVHQLPELPELQKREAWLEKEKVKVLLKYDLAPADLDVATFCNCPTCKDTGKTSKDEPCTCYPAFYIRT